MAPKIAAEVVEIKGIKAGSCFKLFTGIFCIFGLLTGLLLGLRGPVPGTEQLPFLGGLPVVVVGLISGLLCGISGGLVYAVFALLYNIFAAIFGGIKIELKK